MKKSVRWVMGMVMICSIAATCFAAQARADEKKLEVRQGSTMADVLAGLEGTTVEVTLRSGSALAGKLGAVHQHLVVLSELRGKEFYDAVVRIEDISAVTVRMRGR